MLAPCWLQLHKEGLYIPSPHTGHIFQIPAGDRAEDTVTVCSLGPPGLLRRDLLGQAPTTAFEQMKTPQLGLELTLSSDLYMCHGLDGAYPGLFWAVQLLFIQGKSLLTSKPEATLFMPAGLTV